MLRLLENREFRRVGDNDIKTFSARIIAATNKNLTKEVERGNFRQDLLSRLHQHVIHTEPLSRWPEDVVALTNNLQRSRPDWKSKFLIYSYDLPGNVRELKTLLQDDGFEEIRKRLLKTLADRLGAKYEELASLSYKDIMGFQFDRIGREKQGDGDAIRLLEAITRVSSKATKSLS
jgi:transcriptional regulator with GAF, ATPase, and Fis domain